MVIVVSAGASTIVPSLVVSLAINIVGNSITLSGRTGMLIDTIGLSTLRSREMD